MLLKKDLLFLNNGLLCVCVCARMCACVCVCVCVFFFLCCQPKAMYISIHSEFWYFHLYGYQNVYYIWS